MGKIIMCGSFKGGVGKSVTTFNLAYSLAEIGKKVLAVDFDSQANLTTCFGVEDVEALPVTIGHLMMDEYDVTIQSRNTGHYWYLHCTGVPGDVACIIFHKHKYSHPYHQHGRGNSLRQAIRSIQSHDRWQMNGRKR